MVPDSDACADDNAYAATIWDAMHVALSGRIRLDDISGTTAEAILDELWEQHFVLAGHSTEPG